MSYLKSIEVRYGPYARAVNICDVALAVNDLVATKRLTGIEYVNINSRRVFVNVPKKGELSCSIKSFGKDTS